MLCPSGMFRPFVRISVLFFAWLLRKLCDRIFQQWQSQNLYILATGIDWSSQRQLDGHKNNNFSLYRFFSFSSSFRWLHCPHRDFHQISNSTFFIQEIYRRRKCANTHGRTSAHIAAYLFDLIGMIWRSNDRAIELLVSDDANGQLEENKKIKKQMDKSNAQLYKLPRTGR